MSSPVHGRLPDERIAWRSSVPFLLFHLSPLALVLTGVDTTAVVLFVVLYLGRMFFITAGYHRYFAHRSYKTGRVFQFILAFGGTSALQKGPLWWAGNHRLHHRFSDTERDLHSPIKGFWWSHVGWILSDKSSPTPTDAIADFAAIPELRWVNRFDWVAPVLTGTACFLIGGWSGLVFGFLTSTVVLWHSTFLVNSLAHVIGRRRFVTDDTSRNSAIIALLTLGEGWHNNHHHYPASVRQGFYWWEYDVTYYILRMLSWTGVVHALKVPNDKALANARVRDGAFDVGIFRSHVGKAATAVAISRHNAGAAVAASRTTAAERLGEGRDALADRAGQARDGLDHMVEATLGRAEEVARLTRRRPAAATTD